jgi:hypothetical protein
VWLALISSLFMLLIDSSIEVKIFTQGQTLLVCARRV